MTDEEEFAARSQLKWTREGDAWILLLSPSSPSRRGHAWRKPQRGLDRSRLRIFGEYQRRDRSNYPIDLASIASVC